jgi:hypothetical protein
MKAPEDGAIRRSLRRFTLGSGPLKRRSDRVQALGRLVVVLSLLVSPSIAVAMTDATAAHLHRVAETEAAERSRVSAVVVEDARPPEAGDDYVDYSGSPDRPVGARAVWTAPDGTPRDGTVRVPPGTAAGTAVPVWVDREGDVTRAPLDPAGIRGTSVAFGLLPLIGVPLAAWTLYAALCFALDARRERRWGEDWAAVEPVWNSRLL